VITRALGTEPDVDVDTFTVETEPGDIFLLCSDGLTTMVPDREILALLDESRGDLDRAARQLVAAANSSGGEDNITVVVFEMAEAGADAEQTVRLPAAAASGPPEPDLEDTLSGAERVPAVDTAVMSADEVAAHLEGEPDAAPEPEPRREEPPARPAPASRSLLPLFLLVLVLLGIALLVVWGIYR
jgi:protein phosphatase